MRRTAELILNFLENCNETAGALGHLLENCKQGIPRYISFVVDDWRSACRKWRGKTTRIENSGVTGRPGFLVTKIRNDEYVERAISTTRRSPINNTSRPPNVAIVPSPVGDQPAAPTNFDRPGDASVSDGDDSMLGLDSPDVGLRPRQPPVAREEGVIFGEVMDSNSSSSASLPSNSIDDRLGLLRVEAGNSTLSIPP
jgi:hypothetical protein